jgi:prepilin-type N-terminal cleavage/methylation domain-containing protein
MLTYRSQLYSSRPSARGGFTLVELLVVIGIIAILAGVALGPITNGLKKAKQSAGMQQSHGLCLAMYSCANDNSQTYPNNTSGTPSYSTADQVATTLFAGGYISDTSVLYLSGCKCTKYTGNASSLTTGGLQQINVAWDFLGSGSANGSSNTVAGYMPLLWSTTSSEPAVASGSTANTAVAATLGSTTSAAFGSDGLAVAYINNSSKFITSSSTSGALQCVVVQAADNLGTFPSGAKPIPGSN